MYDENREFALVHLEWQIINAMIMENSSIGELSHELNEDHFTDDITRELFSSIKTMYRKYKAVDLVTLRHYLMSEYPGSSIIEVVQGMSREGDVFVPTSQLPYYVKELKKVEKKRAMMKILKASAEMLKQKEIDQTKGYLYEHMAKIHTNGHLSLKDNKSIENLVVSSDDHEYISTGFPEIDNRIIGFREGQYVVLAGRPSSGKTALSLSMIERMCKAGYGGVYFSLETNKATLLKRMASCMTGIKLERILKSQLSEAELKRIRKAVKYMSNYDIHIVDRASMTVTDMYNELVKASERSKLRFVVIDHFTLIRPKDKYGNRTEQLGNISRAVKAMGREFGAIMLNLVQLSRQIEKDRHGTPKMSHLRECGDIEQDADVILAFWNRNEREFRRVRVLKCKEGERDVDIRFGFDGERQQFSSTGIVKESIF